jgi:hypothetical protein
MIALAALRYDQNSKIVDPPGVADGFGFNAFCPICRKTLPYASHQVTHLESKAPTADFDEHSSFVPHST